jgi:hypothetical protein
LEICNDALLGRIGELQDIGGIGGAQEKIAVTLTGKRREDSFDPVSAVEKPSCVISRDDWLVARQNVHRRGNMIGGVNRAVGNHSIIPVNRVSAKTAAITHGDRFMMHHIFKGGAIEIVFPG